MSNTFLENVACPNCGHPIDLNKVSVLGTHIECDACGSTLLLRGHICPYCGTYHEKEVAFCRQCGSPLTRRCAQCQTVNWIGDEYCANCGAALDILEIIVQRYNQDTKERLEHQSDSVQALRNADTAKLQAHLDELAEAERQRIAEVRQRMLKQKTHEQRLIVALAIFFGGVLLVITVALLLSFW